MPAPETGGTNLRSVLDKLDEIRELDELHRDFERAHLLEDALVHTVLREVVRAFTTYGNSMGSEANLVIVRNEALAMCSALVGHLAHDRKRHFA